MCCLFEDSRDPTVARVVLLLGQHCCMPVVCNDRCPVVQSAENCEGPAVAALFKVADVPVVQVVMVPQVLSAVVNVPVITQRQVRVSSTVEVPQIQFTAESWTFPLCNRDWYAAFSRGVMAAVMGLF